MSVEIARCPNCKASLPLEDGVDVIACDYCGTRARVRREGGETVAIELGGTRVWALAVAAVVVAVGLVVAVVAMTGGETRAPSPETETRIAVAEQAPRPPMILGAALEIPGSDRSFVAFGFKVPPGEIRLTAYSRAGEQLWRGDALGDNQVIRGRLFATPAAVIYAGYDGALSTFDARSGARTIHQPTSDVVEGACAATSGVYLSLSGGKQRALAAEEASPRSAAPPGCEPLPALWVGRGVPANRVAGDAARAAGFPGAHHIGAMRLFSFEALALGERGWLVAAVREEGSNLPMLGLVGADKKLRWETVVPGERPLMASPSAPELIGTAGDRAVVSYARGHRQHLAVFAIADGRRLWETDTGVIGTTSASAGADAIYYEGPDRRLRVLDAATGALRLELP